MPKDFGEKICLREINNGTHMFALLPYGCFATPAMVIHKVNNSSQHGIAKVGFRKTGACVKKDLLKRYSIE